MLGLRNWLLENSSSKKFDGGSNIPVTLAYLHLIIVNDVLSINY
jgi:hypothetical protein